VLTVSYARWERPYPSSQVVGRILVFGFCMGARVNARPREVRLMQGRARERAAA
jgi:hypothetical protein